MTGSPGPYGAAILTVTEFELDEDEELELEFFRENEFKAAAESKCVNFEGVSTLKVVCYVLLLLLRDVVVGAPFPFNGTFGYRNHATFYTRSCLASFIVSHTGCFILLWFFLE